MTKRHVNQSRWMRLAVLNFEPRPSHLPPYAVLKRSLLLAYQVQLGD